MGTHTKSTSLLLDQLPNGLEETGAAAVSTHYSELACAKAEMT